MSEQNTVTVAVPLDLANRIAGYLSRQPFADVVEIMAGLQACANNGAQTKTAAHNGAAVNGHDNAGELVAHSAT